MIVITGATGQLGSQIVEHLLERVPAGEIAVSVRDPTKADGLADRGVTVRRGDFSDPSTLAGAFAGASQVLVVSPDTLGDEGVAQSTAAIDAAYAAGAGRVLYTSHQGVGPDARFVPARDHAAVEAHLADVGRPFTSLRNGYYATTSLRTHIGDAMQTGELVAPADGPVAWTAPVDLAAGAAAVLAEEGRFEGATPPLTGPEAVDLAEVAAILSQLSGRETRRVVIDDEEYVRRRVEAGVPEHFARIFLGSFEASRSGDFAAVDPTLEELIGHTPRSIRASLEPVAADAGGAGHG